MTRIRSRSKGTVTRMTMKKKQNCSKTNNDRHGDALDKKRVGAALQLPNKKVASTSHLTGSS